MRKSTLLALATVLATGSLLQAGPLTEARVTKIIKDVHVTDPAKGTHAAAINERITDEIGLKTGVKSRSELLFQDNTLTRIGPETSFSFKAGTRDLTLGQGTMLIQVPKGLGGAKIRTAAVTAALAGTTIMVEHTPAKHIKVLVLEGSLRLSLGDKHHTFLRRHRLMVQIQSSWFPMFDRNPQTFVDIYHASPADYRQAEHKVFRSPSLPSYITLPVLTQSKESAAPVR